MRTRTRTFIYLLHTARTGTNVILIVWEEPVYGYPQSQYKANTYITVPQYVSLRLHSISTAQEQLRRF